MAITKSKSRVDPQKFKNRLHIALGASEHRHISTVQEAVGMKGNTLYKWFDGSFDNSIQGPGAFSLAEVAYELETSPNYLLGFEPAKQGRLEDEPTIEELFECYQTSGGRIEGFQDVIEYCDIYGEPTNGLAQLERVGRLSLQGKKTKKNAERLQAEYAASDSELVRTIYERHQRVWDNSYSVEMGYIDKRLVTVALHARFTYVFAGFRVGSTLSGPDKIVGFAKQIQH